VEEESKGFVLMMAGILCGLVIIIVCTDGRSDHTHVVPTQEWEIDIGYFYPATSKMREYYPFGGLGLQGEHLHKRFGKFGNWKVARRLGIICLMGRGVIPSYGHWTEGYLFGGSSGSGLKEQPGGTGDRILLLLPSWSPWSISYTSEKGISFTLCPGLSMPLELGLGTFEDSGGGCGIPFYCGFIDVSVGTELDMTSNLRLILKVGYHVDGGAIFSDDYIPYSFGLSFGKAGLMW